MIVVLFHAFGELKGLSRESYRRIHHAYQLYQAGWAHQIVCVGGNHGSLPMPGAALMRAAFIDAGVNAARIQTAPPSFDSTTNIEVLKLMAEQEEWRSVLVVSSPLHLVRVRDIDRELFTRLRVGFHAYDLQTAWPDLGFAELWRQAHYEWGAWLLTTLLSRDQLQTLARILRC